MNDIMRVCRHGVWLAGVIALLGLTNRVHSQWLQFGGPDRNFTVQTDGLADSWPDKGPKELWRRKLGDGYSSILVDDGVLYTLYRKTKDNPFEYITALNAENGRTIWKYKVRSPIRPQSGDWPFGPNATPLVVGDRLYVTTVHAALYCLDKKAGKVLWEHDLGGKPEAPLPDGYGYTPSPLLYKNTVIVPAAFGSVQVGGDSSPDGGAEPDDAPGHTLAAFDRDSGNVVWKGGRFTLGHSSPILIHFEGEDQLVLFTKDGLSGFDPDNGNQLWHHPIEANVTNDAIVTPLWNGSDSLFCVSHGNNSGGRMIRLTRKEGKTVPEELWFNRKAFFGNIGPVRVGAHLFGANDKILTCINAETGRVVWRKRDFEGAKFLKAGEKLIILDRAGELALATATAEGLTIHSRCQMLERFAFTPGTLVGTTLYLRDRKQIVALDLD